MARIEDPKFSRKAPPSLPINTTVMHTPSQVTQTIPLLKPTTTITYANKEELVKMQKEVDQRFITLEQTMIQLFRSEITLKLEQFSTNLGTDIYNIDRLQNHIKHLEERIKELELVVSKGEKDKDNSSHHSDHHSENEDGGNSDDEPVLSSTPTSSAPSSQLPSSQPPSAPSSQPPSETPSAPTSQPSTSQSSTSQPSTSQPSSSQPSSSQPPSAPSSQPSTATLPKMEPINPTETFSMKPMMNDVMDDRNKGVVKMENGKCEFRASIFHRMSTGKLKSLKLFSTIPFNLGGNGTCNIYFYHNSALLFGNGYQLAMTGGVISMPDFFVFDSKVDDLRIECVCAEMK